MAWLPTALQKIIEADDLHIAPLRGDGLTHGTPTWIWAVAVEGELYVRAYNGRRSRWYQAAMQQQAGQIMSGDIVYEVVFEQVDGPVNHDIDVAYRAKYHGSQYLSSMVSDSTRAATVRVCLR